MMAMFPAAGLVTPALREARDAAPQAQLNEAEREVAHSDRGTSLLASALSRSAGDDDDDPRGWLPVRPIALPHDGSAVARHHLSLSLLPAQHRQRVHGGADLRET